MKLSPASGIGYGRLTRTAMLSLLLLTPGGHERNSALKTLPGHNTPDVVVLDPMQRAKAAMNSVVELRWEVVNVETGARQPAKGSGFWIRDAKGEWLIATAGHNLKTVDLKPGEPDERRENITVLVYPPEKQPAQPIRAVPLQSKGQEAISISPDFAVLRLTQPGFTPPSGTKPLIFRDLAAEPLVAGEFVAVLGGPEMRSFVLSPGVVSTPVFKDPKIDPLPLIAVKAYTRAGNSGGPAIDAKGRVIGVLVKGHHTDEDIGYLAPNTQTLPLLKDWIDLPPH